MWPPGQSVKTPPSHGGMRGSTPLEATRKKTALGLGLLNAIARVSFVFSPFRKNDGHFFEEQRKVSLRSSSKNDCHFWKEEYTSEAFRIVLYNPPPSEIYDEGAYFFVSRPYENCAALAILPRLLCES